MTELKGCPSNIKNIILLKCLVENCAWLNFCILDWMIIKAANYNAYIKSINIILIVCKCTLYKNKYERNFIST